jgi:site-specific recombinase XerD
MLPTIHVKLRKDKVRDNKFAIVLQVYYEKKQKQIFTGLYIEEKFFDNGKIHSSAPNHAWYRQMIKNKVNETEASFLKQSIEKGTIELTPQKKQTRVNFFEYASAMYRGMANRNSDVYILRCLSKIEEFEAFCGERKSFESITPQLLKDYEDYLFKKPNSRNTINGKFKKIKEVFIDAAKHKLIMSSPFDIFQAVTYKQPKRNYLTIEEIKKIEDVKLIGPLDLVRNYFILSCYTGLRFSDVKKFDKKKSITVNNKIKRIILGTTKTDEIVSIKVTDKIQRILDKIDKPLLSNFNTNDHLKTVGKLAEIDQPLNFHLSRHSFAVNSASLGMPIEAVQALLGHRDIRTTAIYYKLTNSKIDEFMDKWKDV